MSVSEGQEERQGEEKVVVVEVRKEAKTVVEEEQECEITQVRVHT